jgi:hypothetical protein
MKEVLAMRKAFYSETHTSVDGHTSRLFSLTETTLIESEEKDWKAQTESGIWTWKIHEFALHEAGQREGPLSLGNREVLLKKVSEEVTRKAQEKLSLAHMGSL